MEIECKSIARRLCIEVAVWRMLRCVNQKYDFYGNLRFLEWLVLNIKLINMGYISPLTGNDS